MTDRPTPPAGAASPARPERLAGASPADGPGTAPLDRPRSVARQRPGVVVAGRYRLLRRIGRGGMASVWRGRDQVLKRAVAIKLLELGGDGGDGEDDAVALARFRQEAVTGAALNHPHIVSVYDAGQEDDLAYLVMRVVDGQPLSARLAQGPLPATEVRRIGLQVARALDHAHRVGVVHRDVKPANILLDDDRALLTDFGIARTDADLNLTATGQVMGTAGYLAPEQLTGSAAATGRIDQYALGCVLFEALTGAPAFAGETATEVASQRLLSTPRLSERLPSVDPALDEAVARAMALDPSDRFVSCEDFAVALEQAGPALDPVRDEAPDDPPLEPFQLGTLGLIGDRATEHTPTRPQPSATPPHSPGTPQPAPAPSVRQGPQSRAARSGGAPRRNVSFGRPWAVGIAAAAFLLVAGLLLSGLVSGTGIGGRDAADGSRSPQPVAVQGLTDFDPQGGPGENPEQLPLMLDGDPATAWQTEGYNTAAFGNLKEGVGFVADLGSPQRVSAVELSMALPGVSVELRTAEAPPAALADTRVVPTSTTGPAETVRLVPAEPPVTQYLLVWVTGNLQPDGGRFRAAISELTVFGQPA